MRIVLSVSLLLLAAMLVPTVAARDPVQPHAGPRGAGVTVDVSSPADAPYQVTVSGHAGGKDRPAAEAGKAGSALHVTISEPSSGNVLFDGDAKCRVRAHLASGGAGEGLRLQLLCGARGDDAGMRLIVRARAAADPATPGSFDVSGKAVGHVKVAGVEKGIRVTASNLGGTLVRDATA